MRFLIPSTAKGMLIAAVTATNILDKTVNILKVFKPTSLTLSVGVAIRFITIEMNTKMTRRADKIKFNQEFTTCVFLN